MIGYFSVRNFEKFQHYKDRDPPWIRLYNSLLDSYEYAQLPDASKGHLTAIFLLASRYSNKIPLDSRWLKEVLHAHEEIDLEVLARHNFIVMDQECIKMLAECEQNAPQRRGEESIKESSLVLLKPKRIRKRGEPISFTDDQPMPEEFRKVVVQFPKLNPQETWEACRDWHLRKGQETKSIGATARNWCKKGIKILADDDGKLNGKHVVSTGNAEIDRWYARGNF